jgi:hypothetical protein
VPSSLYFDRRRDRSLDLVAGFTRTVAAPLFNNSIHLAFNHAHDQPRFMSLI